MPVVTDSHAKNETQRVNGLIEHLQDAPDDAKKLSGRNLRAWVVDCIESAGLRPDRKPALHLTEKLVQCGITPQTDSAGVERFPKLAKPEMVQLAKSEAARAA